MFGGVSDFSISILSLVLLHYIFSIILVFKIRQKLREANSSHVLSKFFPTCILSGYSSTVTNTSLLHAVTSIGIQIG